VTLQLRPQPFPLDPRVWAALAPEDREFLTGWRQLQAQDWPQAERTFKTLAASHPDRSAVLNNLGVARFQQGDLEGARSSFDQAAALRESPEILLNQSVVAFREMDSSLGSARQEEASRTAPDRISQMVTANHARKDQRTFPTPLPDSPARSRALAEEDDPSGAGSGHGLTGSAGLVALAGLLLPLAAAVLIHLRIRKSISVAHPSQCIRCGDPFHTTDCPDPLVCSSCHHLFNLKDGLHGESRKRKVDEAAAFQREQRRLHRLLRVFLPGMDHCFLGNARTGFLEFGCFCLALGVVLATGRPLRYPGEILPDPASMWLPVGLALLAMICLRSWLKLLPRRS
jgi:hypothetical protein